MGDLSGPDPIRVAVFSYTLDDPTCHRYLDMLAAAERPSHIKLTVWTTFRPTAKTLRSWRPRLSWHSFFSSRRRPSPRRYARVFADHLRRENVSIVHWAFLRELGFSAWRALTRAARPQARTVWTHHIVSEMTAAYRKSAAFRGLDRIVVLSRAMKKHLLADHPAGPPSRFRVIPNGTDASYWRRGGFSGKRDRRLFLAVARINADKGLHQLLWAFCGIQKEFPDARLFVAGKVDLQPDYYRRLKRLAEKLGVRSHVTFLGEVTPETLRRLYHRSLCCVQPSLNEGVSFAALEACAAGCPLVLTRTGGIEEILRHGRDCLFVPKGDPDLLQKAMRRMLVEPGLRERLARNARRRALAQDERAVSRAYIRLYEELAAEGRSARGFERRLEPKTAEFL
ncbi:MAG TPA: glycosyltransferase family 4 protein [Elusimicrobiota bacterium]|nr:glycosyltransferase family 4 protein [Elusimicrobiota bacterium]